MQKLFTMLFVIWTGLASGQAILSQGTTQVNSALSSDGLKRFYFALDQGDQLTLDYTLRSGKIETVRLVDYGGNELYSDFRTNGGSVNVSIPKKSVYFLEFTNVGLVSRAVDYKVTRISMPGNEGFTTIVDMKNITDTIEGNFPSLGKVIYLDTLFEDVLDQEVLVHSQTNSTGPKAVTNFSLPPNTLKVSYYIGVSQEGVDAFKSSAKQLTDEASAIISAVDPLIGLALTGVSTFTTLSGGENIQYYLVENCVLGMANSNLFLQGQPFKALKSANIYNDASVIEAFSCSNLAFCFFNDNQLQSVDVVVKAKALTAKAHTLVKKSVPVIPEGFN